MYPREDHEDANYVPQGQLIHTYTTTANRRLKAISLSCEQRLCAEQISDHVYTISGADLLPPERIIVGIKEGQEIWLKVDVEKTLGWRIIRCLHGQFKSITQLLDWVYIQDKGWYNKTIYEYINEYSSEPWVFSL